MAVNSTTQVFQTNSASDGKVSNGAAGYYFIDRIGNFTIVITLSECTPGAS